MLFEDFQVKIGDRDTSRRLYGVGLQVRYKCARQKNSVKQI